MYIYVYMSALITQVVDKVESVLHSVILTNGLKTCINYNCIDLDIPENPTLYSEVEPILQL